MVLGGQLAEKCDLMVFGRSVEGYRVFVAMVVQLGNTKAKAVGHHGVNLSGFLLPLLLSSCLKSCSVHAKTPQALRLWLCKLPLM